MTKSPTVSVFHRRVAVGGLRMLDPGQSCTVVYLSGAWRLGEFSPGNRASAASKTYVAPSGGATIDTQGRASLAQLAADLADLRTKLS